ncbi:hypothetical protein L3Q67_44230 [Saccharothrix sp. AJ9571]|nr:hypothetical protein L3Q67_44230 [Saccharothrix sp. AJ9571]
MVKKIVVAGALFLLSGCAGMPGKAVTLAPLATPVPAVPTQTLVVQPPVTVTAPPPAVQAPPQPQPPRNQTACQWMHTNGYSYTAAYNAWQDAGYPLNWDADRDGWPCEQSFGDRN